MTQSSMYSRTAETETKGVNVMKEYKKPIVSVVRFTTDEAITLSAESTGKDDNSIGIWELPLRNL